MSEVGGLEKYASEIKAMYTRMAMDAKNRLEGRVSASESFDKLISLISSVEDDSINKFLNGEDLLQKINEVRTDTYAALSSISKAEGELEKISTLLSGINGIINEIGNIDKRLLDFYASSAPERQASLNTLFQNGNNISILNINPAALTSLETLKNRAQVLEKMVTTGNLGMTTNFKKSDGTIKTYSVSGAIYGVIQLITNILGGYGEAVAGLIADNKLNEMLVDIAKDNPNITLSDASVSGTGASKINDKVSKSDITISYNENGVSINVGISAKAQKFSGGKKTTFQTSKLEVYLQSINKKLQYVFLNSLYHNRTTSNDYIIANRYIAAKNFDNAVTGINFAGDQQVYFLFYLNKVYTVADFYNSIAQNANNIKALPFLSVQGKQKALSDFVGKNPVEREDLTPRQKSLLAWQRSRQVRNVMMSLQTQIQYKHYKH